MTSNILYNHLNLPTKVTFAADKYIDYFYDATGVKLEKVVTDGIKITKTKYAGNYIYENTGSGDALKFFNTTEGYVEPVNASDYNLGFNYVYQYKDHLGNIRLSYSDKNKNGVILVSTDLLLTEIVEENNYYPFGLKHKGYNMAINGTHHKYMFGGKEFDESFQTLNTYDFGARNYDPALARWMNIDPLAEQGRRWSPYNYAFDNPVYFVDPDGMWPTLPSWSDVKKTYSEAKATVSKTYNETKSSVTKTYNETKKTFVETTNKAVASTKETVKEARQWVKENEGTITDVSQGMQDVGDGIAVVGYGLTITGVGAGIGVPLAAIGNGLSGAGAVVEIGVQLNNEDLSGAGTNAGLMVADKLLEKGLNKVLPGSGNIKDADFNLDKSILTQGASLKTTAVGRAITKEEEKK